MKPSQPLPIHPQNCYDCGTALKEGDEAIASIDYPLAFCLACRGKKEGKHPRLCKAVVKKES